MIMRNTWFMIMLFLLPLLSMAQEYPQLQYVGIAEENLRAAPQGKKIGSVLQGQQLVVLEESGNWARVQLTGWIWKPSLSLYNPESGKGKLRALHILVETEAEAKRCLQRIRTGEDFSKVAQDKSILPNAERGGDLGFFEKGDFAPVVENAILALDVGEVSDIIKTEYGFNIFKRLQ
ncbi:SH3 domain-containing protein [candidate division KSB1 bacterium]|nr:SH3 domain-containing protein [candidate division KSB1 bacterium]